MLMPSIFGESLLDDFFGFPTMDSFVRGNTSGLMQTDVKEKDSDYEITMNLPGFKKEDVKGELKDGYLVVTASTSSDDGEKDKDGSTSAESVTAEPAAEVSMWATISRRRISRRSSKTEP